jgi:bifunctional non-homologous end joining protein LigD
MAAKIPSSGTNNLRANIGYGLTAEDMKKCRWLKPQLVAAIAFLEWTADGHLRHSKFVAMGDELPSVKFARE